MNIAKISLITALILTPCVTQVSFARSDITVPYTFSGASADKNPYLDVPELGGQPGMISRQQELKIGETVLRQIRHELPIISDPWLEDELAQIFLNLYGQAQQGQPLALVLINDRQINAFAVPGGLFAINAGLITSAQNLDQVAGVMAHEIAHVSQRHYSRSREAFKGQSLLTLAGILAGIAVASQSPDAGAAVMLGSQAAMLDQQLTYSRNQEREADRVGMQYMAIAGYYPESMADFFEVMQRSRPQVSILPDFWMTHPLTIERISEARLRARQYVVNKDTVSLQNMNRHKFELIRWRTAVLGGYANIEQLVTLSKRSTGAALALTTYYTNNAEYAKAKAILDYIKPEAIEQTLYDVVYADWFLAQNKPQDALAQLLPLYQTLPENRALGIKVADLYIANRQPKQAQTILLELAQKFPRDVSVWQHLQRAATLDSPSTIQAIQVLRYRSEVQFWSGREQEAIRSLLHAQRLAQGQTALMARIDKRLDDMQSDRQFKP